MERNASNHRDRTIVGFIGVGAMGRPMAERILEAFDLVVSNRSPHRLEPFRGRAVLASDPAELASKCDVVITCLPTLHAYREVMFGERGVVHGTRLRTLVHVGTTGSPIVREIEDALAAKGVALLDAPISGGPERAARGELVTMVSGPEAALEDARAIIRCYSSEIVYFGAQAGAAQLMKLVNNLLVVSNLVLAGEAMTMGLKGGLELEKMHQVLTHGTGQNYAITSIFPRHVYTRSFDFGGRLDTAAKDYRCVMDEARSLGVPVRVAEAVETVLLEAISRQGGSADFTSLIRDLEESAGTLFPKTRERSGSPPEAPR